MAPRKTARHRSNNGTMRPYKDGERWIAPRRVTLPNGKEALIRGTGRTRTEADARLAANIGKRLQSTSPVAGDDPALGTVEGWARHWLDNIKRHDLRDSTYEGYRNAIDQWIAPRIGDLLLHLLTVEDLELLHAAMKEQGRGRSSWAQVRTVLNQSLEVAVDRGHISVNPARRAPKPGRPTRSLEHLSLEESRKVVKAANTLTERARALLALTLGLRPGECLALRWTDLELDGPQPTVSIARTIARRSGRGLVEGATKTEKSRRTLHLPSHLVETLKDLRIEQEANAGHMSQIWDRDWHVLSDGTARLASMNMLLHGIGTPDGESLIEVKDALTADPGERYSVVLANPPFGTKSSVKMIGVDGKESNGNLEIVRDDFWVTTSNKQLNFVQHIKTILDMNGRATVVLPDNVLFEGGAGETLRRRLLKEFDVHTLLRLPTGIFYAGGVKANVLFFDKKSASETPWTSKLWVYDFRTNQHFTMKQNPLRREHLQDFVDCFKPGHRDERVETEKFKAFSYDESMARDKANLDITWLKDEALEDVENLPAPEVIAQEIVEELQAALNEFQAIAEALSEVGGESSPDTMEETNDR